MRPELVVVVARARNGTIGRGNALPWHLPDDLKHFRALTMGAPIVMGRLTWESLGRALPGRANVVVGSRHARQDVQDAPAKNGLPTSTHFVNTLQEALDACERRLDARPDTPDGHTPRAFLIGGARLFEAALPLAAEAVVTEIDADVEGDVFLSPLDAAAWQEVSRRGPFTEGELPFSIVTYRRRRNA